MVLRNCSTNRPVWPYGDAVLIVAYGPTQIGSEAADKFVENFRYRLRGIDTGTIVGPTLAHYAYQLLLHALACFDQEARRI